MLHELAGTAQRQLFLNVGLVRFDGFYAEVQFFSDLSGSVTLSDQAEHFQFAVAEIGNG